MQGCCILILSCDKYQDLWKPFFHQFWKHWPHCPYPVYLGSNTVSYKGDKRVKTILSGKDEDWSTSLISILHKIPQDHFFLLFDDVFLISSVNNTPIEECFSFLQRKDVQHIHYRTMPPPDHKVFEGKFGSYDRGAPYRVNTLGFWKKNSLLKFLLPGENPWNFEIFGSYRSSYEDGFYCPMQQLIQYIHLVEKGKIYTDADVYCKDHDIPIDRSKRGIIFSEHKFKSELQVHFFNMMLKVPWRWRVHCMNILRKLVISY